MKKLNRNLLLGLGTVTAVAAPVATIVSCSFKEVMGTLFKNQIGSESEAKSATSKILNGYVHNGEFDHDYNEFLARADVFHLFDGGDLSKSVDHNNDVSFDGKQLVGATIHMDQISFHDGNKIPMSWLKFSNDRLYKFAVVPVTLNDAAKTEKQVVMVFQHRKVEGGGLDKLFSGNAFNGWVHDIVGAVVVDNGVTIDAMHHHIEGLDESYEQWFDKWNFDSIWKWW